MNLSRLNEAALDVLASGDPVKDVAAMYNIPAYLVSDLCISYRNLREHLLSCEEGCRERILEILLPDMQGSTTEPVSTETASEISAEGIESIREILRIHTNYLAARARPSDELVAQMREIVDGIR